jgi:hypothetical protein
VATVNTTRMDTNGPTTRQVNSLQVGFVSGHDFATRGDTQRRASSESGHDFTACGKTRVYVCRRERGASAPRITAIESLGFSLGLFHCNFTTRRETQQRASSVSGHDSGNPHRGSRAINATKRLLGFSPCGCFSRSMASFRNLFQSCLESSRFSSVILSGARLGPLRRRSRLLG